MAVLAIPSSSLSSLLLLALLVSSKMLLFGMVEEDLIKAEPLVERCEEWGDACESYRKHPKNDESTVRPSKWAAKWNRMSGRMLVIMNIRHNFIPAARR
jgi:hypothetical protein